MGSTVIGSPLHERGVCAVVIRTLHFDFTAPVRFGDTLTAEATVETINSDRRLVTMAVACRNQRGEAVLNGTAVIKVLREVVSE